MENGPNYHTYTFSIQRSNPLPDAPVENLVFTPLPEGGYKAYLVTYNFTEAEKNIILNGGNVSVNGKSSVTPLEGTFASVMSVENCTMQISDYYTWCSAGKHNNGEICDAGVQSQHIVTMTVVCQGGNSPQPGIEGPGDGGSGEPGGGLGNNNPCSANGVYLQPQDPASSACNAGIVTQPNLPILGDDPCRKTKASTTAANNLLQNPTVQTQMDAVLNGEISAPNEWSIAIGQKPNNEYEVTAPKEGGKTSSTSPNSQLTNPFVGNGHSHAGLPGDPSGGDIYALLERVLIYPEYKFTYTYGVNNGQSEVYALVLNDKAAALQFLIDHPKIDNYDTKSHSIKTTGELGEAFHKMRTFYSLDNSGNTSGENYQSSAVATAYILDKFSSGISVAKVDNNGNLKKINASFKKGGIMGEKAIVSKCP